MKKTQAIIDEVSGYKRNGISPDCSLAEYTPKLAEMLSVAIEALDSAQVELCGDEDKWHDDYDSYSTRLEKNIDAASCSLREALEKIERLAGE